MGKIAVPLCLQQDSVTWSEWVGEVPLHTVSWLAEMWMPCANLPLTPVIFEVYNVALEPTMQNKSE